MKTINQLIEKIVEEHNSRRGNIPLDMERVLQDFASDVIDFACEWLKIVTQCGVHPCSNIVEDFRKVMKESFGKEI